MSEAVANSRGFDNLLMEIIKERHLRFCLKLVMQAAAAYTINV